MKKKVFSVLLVSVLALSLFAQGAKEAGKKEDTSILVMSEWSSDSTAAVTFRERLQWFSDQDNGVKVVQEMIGDETSYYNKLRTRMATAEYPDIFFDYGGARSADYVESGICVDLAPYLEADPEWKEGFLGGVFNEWIYADHPGKIYGVPTSFYCVGLYYNKAIFDKYGLQVPETIEEFEAVCDRLVAEGVIPMSLGEKDNYRAGHLLNNLVFKTYGAQFAYDLGTRKVAYDSPEMLAIYQRIHDWNEKGYFGPNAINKDANMEDADFHNGLTAMHFDGTWFLASPAPAETADDIFFAPFPYEKKEFAGVWMGGSNGGLSVVNTGDEAKIKKAVEVVKSISTPEFAGIQQAAAKGGFYAVKLPAGAPVASRLSKAVADVSAAHAETFVNDIQNYDINPKMLDTVRMALQGLFVGKTPAECAAEIMLVVNAE